MIGILFHIFKTLAETQIKSMNFVYCVTTFSNNESKVLIMFGFYEHTSPKDFSRIEMRTVRLSTMPNKAKWI